MACAVTTLRARLSRMYLAARTQPDQVLEQSAVLEQT